MVNEVMLIDVTIEGTAPLLMHRFSQEAKKASSKKVQVYDPKEEAEKACYRNKEGKLFVPSTWIEGCMIRAASNFKQGKKTMKDQFKGSILVPEEEILIEPQEYEIDNRRVVVVRSAIIRSRPIFKQWKLSFTITNIDTEMIDKTLIKEVLVHAGKYIGIGDFRPKFGRFNVTKFEVRH